MSKPLTILATLLLAGAVAFAQGGYPGSSGSGAPDQATGQAGSSQRSGMEQQKISGCLTGSEGNYMLVSDAGTTYRLEGKDKELKDLVNHQVEVEGNPSAAGMAKGQSGGTAGAATAGAGSDSTDSGQQGGIAGRSDPHGASGAATQSLRVSDVSKIADTCTSSQGGASGSDTRTPQP